MNFYSFDIDESFGSKYETLDNILYNKPVATEKQLKSSKLSSYLKISQIFQPISFLKDSSDSFCILPNLTPSVSPENSSLIKSDVSKISLNEPTDLVQQTISFLSSSFKYSPRLYLDPNYKSLNLLIQSLPAEDKLLISSLLCVKCRHILIPISLSCAHSICYNCFSSNLKSFIDCPSLPLLKKVSCPECHRNFSLQDIEKYSDYLNSFLSADLKINCEICNFPQIATQNYWSECPCFHLCSNCYADCLMMNGKKCRFCGVKFWNSKTSLKRKSVCGTCGAVEKAVEMCHRNIEGIKCFKCLQKLVGTNDRAVLKKLSVYINKICCVCKETKNIADLVQKFCCSYPICEGCSPFNVCLFCIDR